MAGREGVIRDKLIGHVRTAAELQRLIEVTDGGDAVAAHGRNPIAAVGIDLVRDILRAFVLANR